MNLAVKDIDYKFNQNNMYNQIKYEAIKTVKEIYKDEQEFEKDEFTDLLNEGEISDYDDYKKNVLHFQPQDIDYSKDFEENINHPIIQNEIQENTNKYMRNYYDLPKNVVISIDDNIPDDIKEIEVKKQILNKVGIDENIAIIRGFTSSDKEASKSDMLAQLSYDKIGEMIKSNDYKTYLDLRASIGKYSSSNIDMIYAQKSDSKAVMGFNAWKKLNRCVSKGQKGIHIWCPCNRILKTEKSIDYFLAKNTYTYGDVGSPKSLREKDRLMKEIKDKGQAEVFSGYRLGVVFDVAQTISLDKEDNIKDIIMLNKPLLKDYENYENVAKSIEDASTLYPFTIDNSIAKENKQEALYQSIYNYADKVFSEIPEKINGIKSNEIMKGEMHEIETAMATHIICSHIGIDCGEKTGLKLANIFNKEKSSDILEMGKRTMFTKSFDRATKLSDEFVKEFDKSFGIDIEAQRNKIKKDNENKEPSKKKEEIKNKNVER